eukprot:scaffold1454_cov112-Isochrysis_galbana.AAC.1
MQIDANAQSAWPRLHTTATNLLALVTKSKRAGRLSPWQRRSAMRPAPCRRSRSPRGGAAVSPHQKTTLRSKNTNTQACA